MFSGPQKAAKVMTGSQFTIGCPRGEVENYHGGLLGMTEWAIG